MKKILFVTSLILISCNQEKQTEKIFFELPQVALINEKKDLGEDVILDWHHKDVFEDTIPGLSLNKTFKYLENNKMYPKDTVIVAVLDTPIDIEHEDLKGHIWQNPNETPNNNIDDDNNGYTDDYNGWNFLINKEGNQISYVNNESTRIVKKYREIFKDSTYAPNSQKDSLDFALYKKALKLYDSQLDLAKEDTAYINMLYGIKKSAHKNLSKYFPKLQYNIEKLDSLSRKYPKDTLLQDDILRVRNFIEYGITEDYLKNYREIANSKFNKLLNFGYEERKDLDKSSFDIKDNIYGGNKVSQNLNLLTHGTVVAGAIAGNRDNSIGVRGVSNSIKIMPVCVSAVGEEHDKDIALGIRYAVDNGAKVINMSFGKKVSLYQNLVQDAIQYAYDNEVLIVSSVGNENRVLNGSNEYPNGKIDGHKSFENFIHVGASNFRINEKLKASFSNYSKENVDVFAPGTRIRTLNPNNQYIEESGTSMASALISGVAGLIWSYFPDLSAKQMKEILLKTGISYNINVEVKQDDDTIKLVPFTELSKSGKVVNAYNALMLASKLASSK